MCKVQMVAPAGSSTAPFAGVWEGEFAFDPSSEGCAEFARRRRGGSACQALAQQVKWTRGGAWASWHSWGIAVVFQER